MIGISVQNKSALSWGINMHASPWYRFLIFPIALLWLTTPVKVEPVQAEDDGTLRNRFLKEAPHGWEQLRSVLLHSKGRLSLSVRLIKPPDDKSKDYGYDEDVSFMLNGSGHRRVVSNDRGHIDIGCRNPQYTFLLQAANKSTGVYRVDEIVPHSPQKLLTAKRQGRDHVWRIYPLIYSPFAIRDDELTDIVQSKTFQLQSVRAIGEPEQGIEVRFRYEPPVVDKQVWDVILTLDPGNSWAVQHYRREFLDLVSGNVGVHDCTLRYGKDPFPGTSVRLPSMATFLVADKKDFDSGGKYEKWELAVKEFAVAEIPESEFMLSAFGLTEAGESTVLARRRSHLPVLLISLGVVLAIIGIWFARRRSPTAL